MLWSPTNHRSWKVTKLVGVSAFVARYFLALRPNTDGIIDASVIESVLRSIFVNARVVGDKQPDYVFALDELVKDRSLRCLVIYRDCRDVVCSNLERARTIWRGKPWGRDVDTAEKVARRWVSSIQLMERHRTELHAIRYEDLVHRPDPVLAALGEWLDVEPAGFPKAMVRSDRVGNHRIGLTDDDLETVMHVAGPTMSRLGYPV